MTTLSKLKEEGKYDREHFRLVKHGTSEINAYCRHCNWTNHSLSPSAAKYHAKKTLHTVDVYRENWTEYTSYISKTK